MRSRGVAIAVLLVQAPFLVSAQAFDYSPGFEPGVPMEMTPLSFLPGDWRVALFTPVDPTEAEPRWQPWDTTASRFEAIYGGAFVREIGDGFPIGSSSIGADGFDRRAYQATFSWDRFQRLYRVTYIDNITGLLDIYQGPLDDGQLIVTNLHTGTYNTLGTDGSVQFGRLIVSEIADDRFVMTWQWVNPVDVPQGGAVPWRWGVRMIYQRKR
jgi:hypothetical protein